MTNWKFVLWHYPRFRFAIWFLCRVPTIYRLNRQIGTACLLLGLWMAPESARRALAELAREGAL